MKTTYFLSTGWMGWMAHRKWKEIKQQPGKMGQATCLAVAYFLSISCGPSTPSAMYFSSNLKLKLKSKLFLLNLATACLRGLGGHEISTAGLRRRGTFTTGRTTASSSARRRTTRASSGPTTRWPTRTTPWLTRTCRTCTGRIFTNRSFSILIHLQGGVSASPLRPGFGMTLIFGVPLSSRLCLGKWEFGRIGWATR